MSNAIETIRREDAEKLVASIGIPPRPTVVLTVMDAKASDDVDMAAVVRAIATDVGITAALIKTVNSPLYGLRRRVESVAEAASMLGINSLATLVTSLALKTTLVAGGIERFWDQSARIALIAAWLAGRYRLARDEAHLFGLFRDAGIPLLMKRFPDYRDTLRLANTDTEGEFTHVEEARHNLNHAVVGALLCRNWKLSDTLHDAVLRHHELGLFDSDSPATVKNLVAIGHLASQLESLHTRSRDDEEWMKIGHAVETWLMISADDLDELHHEAGSMLLEAGL